MTIRGYRSAIARVYKLCGFYDCGHHPLISAVLTNMDLLRPRQQVLFPQWDLDIVLSYLQSDVFQPMDTIDLTFLTYKAVFLVALASALRVSELHALSVIEDCCCLNIDGSISLTTCPGFIAKNKTPSSAPQQLHLRPLLENPGLCPVAALKLYLQRTRQFRGQNLQLFVSPKSPQAKTTPQLLSAFIRSTVQRAYEWKATQLDGTASSSDTQAHPTPLTDPDPSLSDGRASPTLPAASGGAPAEVATSSAEAADAPAADEGFEALRQSAAWFASGLSPSSTEVGLGRSRPVLAPSCSPADDKVLDAGRYSPQPSSTMTTRRRLGAGPLTGRTAHELRALASSLAYHRGTPLDEIVRAVGWAAPSTFARFYLRHLSADPEPATSLRLPCSKR